jgi:phosphoenolpyruvate---glycerone phosphotransferase subunit DhaL
VLDRAALAEALEAAAGAIAERSGAVAGDKSVLDSVLAIAAALKAERGRNMLSSAVDAAARVIDDFRGQPCRLGRARMYGERSVGRDDPGMLAALLLLRAVRD